MKIIPDNILRFFNIRIILYHRPYKIAVLEGTKKGYISMLQPIIKGVIKDIVKHLFKLYG